MYFFAFFYFYFVVHSNGRIHYKIFFFFSFFFSGEGVDLLCWCCGSCYCRRCCFTPLRALMVYRRSLRDNKSFQVSRTFLSILANLSNAVVWIVFTIETITWNDISRIGKLDDRSRGWPEGFLFNSYYTEVLGKALLYSLDCFTLPWIHTL